MKKMTPFENRKSTTESSWPNVQRILSLSCALGIMAFGGVSTLKAGNAVANTMTTVAATVADKAVTGVVKDKNGEGIPGALVKVKGTQIAVSTDVDGKFTLSKVPDGAELVFSCVGMETKTMALGTQSKFEVTLDDESHGLNEVVVTAMGIKRESKALGYAVSTVNSTELVKTATPNFATALYGKLAGVRVEAAPGGATSAVSFSVRGLNSLTGTNQPLIIVDGIPIRNGDANNDGYWTDQRVNGNGLIDINPEDIDNISVLKGSAATTLYGSEGANGVVMITTKTGKSSKGLGVNFNASISGDFVAYMPQYQTTFGPGRTVQSRLSNGNAYELSTGGFTQRAYNGTTYKSVISATGQYGPKYDGSNILYYDGTERPYSAVSANPWSDVFRTAINQNYNLAISQGNEKSSFRLSYTYLNSIPNQYNSSYNKHNFALSGAYKLNNNLGFDYKVNYILQNINNRPYRVSRLTNNFSGMFSAFDDVKWLRNHTITSLGYLNSSSTTNTLTPNESFAYSDGIAVGSLVSEYFWNILGKKQIENNNRLIASFVPHWNITKELTLKGMIATDYTGLKQENMNRTEIPNSFSTNGNYTGAYSLLNSNYQIVYGDVMLNYNKNLTEKLGLNANLGWSGRTEDYYSSTVGTNGGLANENWFTLASSALTPNASMGETHFLKDAYLITTSFSWDNFLYLDLNGRSETTSSLNGGKSLYYGAASTSFIFTQALAKSLPKWYNYGKLRMSYGATGNSPELYKAMEAFNQRTASGYIYNTTKPNLGNDLIKPERKSEFEIGVENKMFENRLGLEATYYSNKTKDEILEQSVGNSSGATSKLLNVGEVKNYGIELAVYGTPFQNKDWRVDVNANLLYNKNKVTKLNDGSNVLTNVPNYDNGAMQLESHVGRPAGDLYAYAPKTDSNGNYIVGADGFYELTDERVRVGNVQPKFTGGVSVSIAYKSFSLDLTMDYRIGGSVANIPYEYLMGRGSLKESMKYRDAAHGGLPYYIPNNNASNMPVGIGSTSAPAGAYTFDNGMILPGVKADGSKNDMIIPSDRWYNWTYNWGTDAPTYYSHAVFDNTYLKMREITLSYSLPVKLTSKFSCKSLVVSAFTRNPFYIYKNLPIFDAEFVDATNWASRAFIGGSTVTTRTFGMSLRMQF